MPTPNYALTVRNWLSDGAVFIPGVTLQLGTWTRTPHQAVHIFLVIDTFQVLTTFASLMKRWKIPLRPAHKNGWSFEWRDTDDVPLAAGHGALCPSNRRGGVIFDCSKKDDLIKKAHLFKPPTIGYWGGKSEQKMNESGCFFILLL